MKKVLIISYFFNQKEKIGSIRLRGLAKYLPEFGWKPTVLTVKSDSENETYFRSVETEYLDIMDNWKSKIGLNSKNTIYQSQAQNNRNKNILMEYLLNIGVEIFAYPDSQKNWIKPAVEAGSKLLENEHFDAIISSSSPVTCHLIAHKLKKRYKIPWIADFRDLWTQNYYYPHSKFRKFIESRLELKTIKYTDALVTVSEPLRIMLEEMHNKKNVYAISNGFDPDKINHGTFLTDKFTITYSGTLYNGKRSPHLLFKALKELSFNGEIKIEDFSIDFYGHDEGWLINIIKKYGLDGAVRIRGEISRDEILKKQRKSQLLLLLTWNDPKEAGIVPGKIFEYLSSKRPIISIGPSKSLVKEIIESTNSGIHSSNLNEIKDKLKEYYDEFKLNGEVNYNGIDDEINKYSQVEMAKKFAIALNNTINL